MSGILPRARSGIVTVSTLIEQTGGMRTKLGRTARLAAAALTGLLAATAGCAGSSGAGSSGGGSSTGSAPPTRALTVAPNGRRASRRGLAHVRPRLRPYRGRHRRGPGRRVRLAARQLAGQPGRRGLRAAAPGRHDGDRGDRERLPLRARRLDRPGPLADPRRHPGAAGRPAVRRHRPARHHRHARLRRRQRARLRGGRDLRVPPRAGRRLGRHRRRHGGTRHPDPGRPAAI